MIFVVDPSESCGYELAVQEKLLKNIEDSFEGVTIIVAESKSDIMRRDNGRISFSAQTGDGMDVLTAEILGHMRRIFREKSAEVDRWRTAPSTARSTRSTSAD